MLDVIIGGAVAVFAFFLYLIVRDAYRVSSDAEENPPRQAGDDSEAGGVCRCRHCYRRLEPWPHDHDPKI